MFGPTGCIHPLVDASPLGLRRHLERYHSAQLSPTSDGLYKCHWQLGIANECDKWLSACLGLAKHIRRVHLKTDEVCCEYCEAHFTRPDALERHILKTCKEKPVLLPQSSAGVTNSIDVVG